MVRIVYIQPDMKEVTVEAEEGMSVMEAAVKNDVDGIVAECGGACSCATCHAYVGADWLDTVGPAGDDEKDMLEFAADPRPASRLTCQIRVAKELDGLKVHVPAEQG